MEPHPMASNSPDPGGMSFEEFKGSFYYGAHADMQFKYLDKLSDAEAADTIAELLALLGEAFDTGDLTRLRQAAFEAQTAAYTPDEPPAAEVDDAPFAPLKGPLSDQRLVLISAGGVFVADDDPMGPDAPTQEEAQSLIIDFLRGTPTLSTIPRDTPTDRLTARHPGYDARTAQRDIGTVFPLGHLRDVAGEGRVQLVDEHYGFTGATSQGRLREQVAPRWAEHMAAREVDVAFLVAT
jgi:hypothetical protein